ncbi:MAG: hypothetical protein H6573_23895 [Lewinellaceae bacterium]|nr:hypothetical protein [Phaeodactylibacter sp.]MCB9350532.1 hypothetical protein [Lewinellaceae bacterium]
MAVEIKELIIRAVVDYRQEDEKSNPGAAQGSQEVDKEAIIQACVRQVLRIINRSNKR